MMGAPSEAMNATADR